MIIICAATDTVQNLIYNHFWGCGCSLRDGNLQELLHVITEWSLRGDGHL